MKKLVALLVALTALTILPGCKKTPEATGLPSVSDTSPPTVVGVTSTNSNGTYGTGQVITVQVQFSEAVDVNGGVPYITLEMGATDRNATYVSGTGTTTLVFTYTLVTGDTNSDLDYVNTASLNANGATIQDAALNDAVLTLANAGAAGSISDNQAVVVDTTSATVTNVVATNANGTYGIGQTISVNVVFSKPVYVNSGTPFITLEMGATDRDAAYVSGSGTSTLSFQYTLVSGDTNSDLDYVASTSLDDNGATIEDSSFNAAILTLADPGDTGSISDNQAIVIDTDVPTVTGVVATNANGNYTIGDVITVQVAFSEIVNVAGGTPSITLEMGTTDRDATYASGSGTNTLVFTYTLVAGDSSADLDYTTTNALALNGATIRDVGSNNATLTLAAPAAAGSISDNQAIVVNTTNQCSSPVTQVVDYGIRRTAGAALNVRGAYSDIKLIPGTNYPAVVYGETNSTAGVNTIKYQYWDGSQYQTETIAGGLTTTFIRLVYLSTGRPLVFWGNGATAVYMASRSTGSLTAGTWTVTAIDTTSTAVRAIDAVVNPADQVLVSFTAANTSSAVKASICTSNCHLAASYTAMGPNPIDAGAGAAMHQMGVGWCKHAAGYYPAIVYSDTANAMLAMCRNGTLSNCTDGAAWTTLVTLTGSGAALIGTTMYNDMTATDGTLYMVAKLASGLRPYSFPSCATSAAVTAADPGTNYVANSGTVGNAFFSLGFDGSNFHVAANDAQINVKYYNQSLASFGSGAWNTSTVETTGAAGIAAAGVTRGGMAIDTVGDQVLISYGRTLAVTPVQTFANVVVAYNDCPSGLGAPACASTTLGSSAASTGMSWGNLPFDFTGQVQRNSLQVPNVAASATSAGVPATAYVDFSIGISAEPATGALLKYAYRNGPLATDPYIVSVVPTTTAPSSPSLAFDHNNKPWIAWYESSTGTGGFRYYLATNSRTDGTGAWSVYAYPIGDAAAPTLPVMNQTALAMYWNGGVAKPVMIILRHPASNKGVYAAQFNSSSNQWEYQQQVMTMTGTSTIGGGWISSDYDTSGNIVVAVHDLGTGAGASCSPTTTKCVRFTSSTNGGSTWASAGQIYTGNAEGLDVKINPTTNRPAISFYNRSLNLLRYKYCTSALASCTSSGNWADIDTGVVDNGAGISGLVDGTNTGLLTSSLTFDTGGSPTVVWPRGAGAVVNPNLMFSTYSTATSLFSSPATLKANSFGNETSPVAANAGNFGLSWAPASVRTEIGSLHSFYTGPGNFLYSTSCGN